MILMILRGWSPGICEKMFSNFSKECDTEVNQWNVVTVIEVDTSTDKSQKYYREGQTHDQQEKERLFNKFY